VLDRAPDAVLNDRTAPPARGRALLVELYDAAVAGAAPGPLTTDALTDLGARPEQRLWLYAFGKAAHPMASAAVAALQRSRNHVVAGVVVSPEAHPAPAATITSLAGDHPIPGPRSFAAAQRIGDLAVGMRSDDVALVLISGGATSLIGAPLHGTAEEDFL
jgi:glycerate 2-kinase